MGDHDKPSGMIEKAFRAGITGQRFIDIVGLESAGTITDTDGPCERFMTGIQRIDGLRDAKSAYSTGRALLFIGASLDSLFAGIRDDSAPAVAFVNDLQRQVLSHNARDPVQPWTGKHTIDFYGQYPMLEGGKSMQEVDAGRWESMAAGVIAKLDGPSGIAPIFSHPSLLTIHDEILPLTPAFHVTAEQYFELECAQWRTEIAPTWIPETQSFLIHVDGNEWFPMIDDKRYQYRTDFLFAGFENLGALIMERVSTTGPRIEGIDARVWGVDFDFRRRSAKWRSTVNATVDGKRIAFTPDDRELRRMVRVTLGFALLLQHPDVTTTPIKSALFKSEHARIVVAKNLTIDAAISAVISSKKKAS